MCAISVDFSSANLKVAGGFNNPARKLCEFHETIEHSILETELRQGKTVPADQVQNPLLVMGG